MAVLEQQRAYRGAVINRAPAPLLLGWPGMATNLSGSILRGRSFAGTRMRHASLAGADLRGADLTGADLRGADLSRMRGGLSRRWTVLVMFVAFSLLVGIGALAGAAGSNVHQAIASAEPPRRAMGILVAAALSIFLVLGIWRGLRWATRHVLPLAAALCAAAGLWLTLSGAGAGTVELAVMGFLPLVVAMVAVSALARVMAGATGSYFFFAVVAGSGAMTGRALGGGVAALAIAIAAMLMARQTRRRQDVFPLLARVSAVIACHGGTRLCDADLTGANLAGAHLVGCDFRGARLVGTHFDAAEIHLCRFGGAANRPPLVEVGDPRSEQEIGAERDGVAALARGVEPER